MRNEEGDKRALDLTGADLAKKSPSLGGLDAGHGVVGDEFVRSDDRLGEGSAAIAMVGEDAGARLAVKRPSAHRVAGTLAR